jgi:hypothetical protein
MSGFTSSELLIDPTIRNLAHTAVIIASCPRRMYTSDKVWASRMVHGTSCPNRYLTMRRNWSKRTVSRVSRCDAREIVVL